MKVSYHRYWVIREYCTDFHHLIWCSSPTNHFRWVTKPNSSLNFWPELILLLRRVMSIRHLIGIEHSKSNWKEFFQYLSKFKSTNLTQRIKDNKKPFCFCCLLYGNTTCHDFSLLIRSLGDSISVTGFGANLEPRAKRP